MDSQPNAAEAALQQVLTAIAESAIPEDQKILLADFARQNARLQAQPLPSPADTGQPLQAPETRFDGLQAEQVENEQVRIVFSPFVFALRPAKICMPTIFNLLLTSQFFVPQRPPPHVVPPRPLAKTPFKPMPRTHLRRLPLSRRPLLDPPSDADFPTSIPLSLLHLPHRSTKIQLVTRSTSSPRQQRLPTFSSTGTHTLQRPTPPHPPRYLLPVYPPSMTPNYARPSFASSASTWMLSTRYSLPRSRRA